jgi:molybdopterin-guanine dinucleotide biosynthesis protein A
MGGIDKGLLSYQGRTLVAHVAEVLRPQAARVLVSANRSEAEYRALGFEPLPDLRPDFAGPLAGLEAGVAACRTPWLLVCPCDTPHVPSDYGERLWRCAVDHPGQLAYAWDGERAHYLNLLLPISAASDLTGYLDSGQRAVRHWLAQKPCAQALFDVEELANLNTAADLTA